MLLGIPGDNTYSNYQEATRSLWRQTVLPLATRTAKALSQWLSPAYGGGSDPAGLTPSRQRQLELRPDYDAIEALTSEREALWSRVDKATFLTQNEKRAAVGYGPAEGSDPPGLTPSRDLAESPSPLRGGVRGGGSPNVGNDDVLLPGLKYDPDQPRVPAGESDGGRWTTGGGSGGTRLAQGRLRGLFGRPTKPVPIPPGTTIRNKDLAGKKHPDTGIPFDKDGFPDFSSVATHTVKLPHTGTPADFTAANRAAGFASTPPGMTWHHHQDGRTMQLVPSEIHRRTGHTGSRGIQNLPGRR